MSNYLHIHEDFSDLLKILADEKGIELDNQVAIGFYFHFGEISYLVINQKNRNEQKPDYYLKESSFKRM